MRLRNPTNNMGSLNAWHQVFTTRIMRRLEMKTDRGGRKIIEALEDLVGVNLPNGAPPKERARSLLQVRVVVRPFPPPR